MKKTIKAWALLDRTSILFVGRCDNFAKGATPLNHLEIFPTRRDAIAIRDEDENTLEVVPVEITYQLPKKP